MGTIPVKHTQPNSMAPTDKTAQPSTGNANANAGAGDAAEEAKKTLPQLGALEEDDEFEEFEADGETGTTGDGSSVGSLPAAQSTCPCAGQRAGPRDISKKTGSDSLVFFPLSDSVWNVRSSTDRLGRQRGLTLPAQHDHQGQVGSRECQHNNGWQSRDDDDIEDDFSVQLRKAISEHNGNGPAPMAT